jgi:hypothetical protein
MKFMDILSKQSNLASLRRFMRQKPPEEVCELCSKP